MAPELRERLRAVPGMERLLPALEGLPRAFLVGGAVRDILLGIPGVDVDIAVEGDGPAVAQALARRLGGRTRRHERFGTATVQGERLSFDVASTRRETYPEPGALPVVAPASLEEDLARRDFSINAMALALTGDELGRLHDPLAGRRDLDERIVRVLHDASFVDDPTRLLRALRYEARLGFRMDPETERLAREAAAGEALATVSGPRIREELLRLLGELEAPSAVARMADLGIAAGLHPDLDPDAELVASASLGSAETGADRALAGLAALCSSAPEPLAGWLGSLGLAAAERRAVTRAADAPLVARALRSDLRPSGLYELLRDEPPELLALVLALGAPPEPVLRFVSHLRHTRLEISGDDLLAAGVPESPQLGLALEETLRRKLDGEVSGREAELRTALGLARGAGE